KFQRARYAMVGTTALIAFIIDRAKENVWIASLGFGCSLVEFLLISFNFDM
ncbi:MAG: hypothetical protein NXY57DRAFT_900337, partial [Lentinula lateritia]